MSLIWILFVVEKYLIPMDIGKTAIKSALASNNQVYIIGSSHVYWAYNPFEIEKISKLSTSLASTSSQTFEQSYFIAKKLLKNKEVKVIFLETYMINDKENKNIKENSWNIAFDYLNVFDRFEISRYYLGKVDYKYVFNIYKYHSNWKKNDIIKENFKNSKESFGIKFTRNNHPFKGFIPHSNRIPDTEGRGYKRIPEDYFDKNLKVVKDKRINIKYEKLLLDLFEECKKNKVKLILITSPFYYQHESAKKICEYSNYLSKLAKNNESELINFNYLYEELELNRSYFKDSGHLNKYGAKILSNYLGNYLKSLFN